MRWSRPWPNPGTVRTTGLTWTFRLRDDVRWHDGTPLTAHDVEFTFNRIIYNEDHSGQQPIRRSFSGSRMRPAMRYGRSKMTVTALDDHTVSRFILPTPFAPFPPFHGDLNLPQTHPGTPCCNDGTFTDTWSVDTDPATVIGTGPFTIESYVPRSAGRAEPQPRLLAPGREGYLPAVSRPDRPGHCSRPRCRARGFPGGPETDSHGVLGSEFSDLYPLQQAEDFTIHRRGPSLRFDLLGIQHEPGVGFQYSGEPFLDPEKLNWFTNRQFRQAVAHSIDRDAIINDVQHGLGYPQWASVSPAAGDFHNPGTFRRYEYDLDRANSLLDDLGWVDTDGDGTRAGRLTGTPSLST